MKYLLFLLLVGCGTPSTQDLCTENGGEWVSQTEGKIPVFLNEPFCIK